MKLKSNGKLKLRLSLKARIFLSLVSIALILIIKVLFFTSVFKSEKATADTCIGTYTLDWGNPATYTVTCGDVNAANWSVKGLDCYYYSPVIEVGGAVGGPNGLVDISVRINQSGNVDGNDTAKVFFYNNGVVTHTDVFIGSGSPAVFISTKTLSVSPGGTFRVSIELKNDKTNELWQVKNGDVTACIRGISPLPVQLTRFALKNVNESAVLLNWTTASETNNDYFTIERSGSETEYTEIARIRGAGNSNRILNYEYTDSKPYNGTSYYRLKQTDYNGHFETFKPLAVTIAGKTVAIENAIAYPNPFIYQLNISFDTKLDGVVKAEISSINGSLVHSEIFNVIPGRNQYNFTTTGKLKDGNYIIRFIHNGHVLYSKQVSHKTS